MSIYRSTPADCPTTERPYEHWPTDSLFTFVRVVGDILSDEWHQVSEERARGLGGNLRDIVAELHERGIA